MRDQAEDGEARNEPARPPPRNWPDSISSLTSVEIQTFYTWAGAIAV